MADGDAIRHGQVRRRGDRHNDEHQDDRPSYVPLRAMFGYINGVLRLVVVKLISEYAALKNVCYVLRRNPYEKMNQIACLSGEGDLSHEGAPLWSIHVPESALKPVWQFTLAGNQLFLIDWNEGWLWSLDLLKRSFVARGVSGGETRWARDVYNFAPAIAANSSWVWGAVGAHSYEEGKDALTVFSNRQNAWSHTRSLPAQLSGASLTALPPSHSSSHDTSNYYPAAVLVGGELKATDAGRQWNHLVWDQWKEALNGAKGVKSCHLMMWSDKDADCRWIPLPNLSCARGRHTAQIIENKLIVVGGRNVPPQESIEMLDLAAVTESIERHADSKCAALAAVNRWVTLKYTHPSGYEDQIKPAAVLSADDGSLCVLCRMYGSPRLNGAFYLANPHKKAATSGSDQGSESSAACVLIHIPITSAMLSDDPWWLISAAL